MPSSIKQNEIQNFCQTLTFVGSERDATEDFAVFLLITLFYYILVDQFLQEGLAVQVFQHIPETKIQMVFTFTQYQKSNTKPISEGTQLKPTLYSVSYIASGKVIWIPESKKFLLVEYGVLA